jgi:hypothetical protein
MGAAKVALVAVAAGLALFAGRGGARADSSCTGETASGGRFATCFDPGNRLLLKVSTDGFGAVVQLRHIIHFDDEPDLVWKMEHTLAETTYLGLWQRYGARVYSGRYLRHARDGHIIWPLSTTRKLFLPFDVGAETDVGALSQQIGDDTARLGIVRTAALIDIGRSESFSHHLALGAVARWDVDLTNETMIDVVEHHVAPFSTAVADAYAESSSGLTLAALRVEGGTVWSSEADWVPQVTAAARLERVVIALNDRPMSLFGGVRYDSERSEVRGEVGLGFALFQRRDRRVNLTPLPTSTR